MSTQKTNLKELSEKLPELINAANDKLTVILGSAEMALLDLNDGASVALLPQQLHNITMLSEEIGLINGKIIGLVTGVIGNEKSGK